MRRVARCCPTGRRCQGRKNRAEILNQNQRVAGAPEEIRTPDPQIRSLVLYPAELRALEPLAKTGPRQHGIAIDLVTYWQGLPLAALPAPARRASCRD